MKTIRIKIVNFEAYKGRGDVKHNSWFRCSNRLLEDHEFFNFTHEELLVWLYLLSISSQKNTSDIVVSYQHAHQVCRLRPAAVTSALEKLRNISCIEIARTRTLRGRYANDTQTCATRQTDITDITEQDTTVTARPAKPPAPPTNLELNRKIWEAYSLAYLNRYGTEPVRNAPVNAKIKQIGQRIGNDGPAVAAFYVKHNKQFYVTNMHSVGLFLSDCEALRTQWATGNAMTNKQAQQIDASATTAQLLRDVREGKI